MEEEEEDEGEKIKGDKEGRVRISSTQKGTEKERMRTRGRRTRRSGRKGGERTNHDAQGGTGRDRGKKSERPRTNG